MATSSGSGSPTWFPFDICFVVCVSSQKEADTQFPLVRFIRMEWHPGFDQAEGVGGEGISRKSTIMKV